jgi:hypothetical protein
MCAFHAARDREAVKLRLAVELTVRGHRSADSIDVDALHGQQVNNYPAIDGRASRHVVAAATNRNLTAEPGREIDGVHDIGPAALATDAIDDTTWSPQFNRHIFRSRPDSEQT